MPELPEVETIVRGLAPALRGRRDRRRSGGAACRCTSVAPSIWGAARASPSGGTIRDVRRVGKYILIVERRAAAGPTTAASGVVIHLGMTGRLRVQPGRRGARAAHARGSSAWRAATSCASPIPRRFGWVEPRRPLAATPALAALGPDPLTALDAAALAARAAGVRAPIKAFLLDQRRVAGLGNIYVSRGAVPRGHSPVDAGGAVAAAGAPALLTAIRASLEGGIARRGTTLRDYVDADGLRGDNAAALLVYGRDGQPASRCGTPIRRRVDAGRATFFCPRCQKR